MAGERAEATKSLISNYFGSITVATMIGGRLEHSEGKHDDLGVLRRVVLTCRKIAGAQDGLNKGARSRTPRFRATLDRINPVRVPAAWESGHWPEGIDADEEEPVGAVADGQERRRRRWEICGRDKVFELGAQPSNNADGRVAQGSTRGWSGIYPSPR